MKMKMVDEDVKGYDECTCIGQDVSRYAGTGHRGQTGSR